jgi:eukaryotic-like serine/threonine-protein kinase
MQSGYLLRNRYAIQQPLASGYFGDTYLAIDRDYYGQRYAIVKHLKPQSKDPAVLQVARRLFETEAMALRRLSEKTDLIPKLYAYFEEEDEFYLVQEYIDGQTLSQELVGTRLSTSATIKILFDILTALSIVHAENMIHRDLKPDNIIRRSSDRALVLIDFGAVKEVRQSTLATLKPKTLPSIGFGTEGYMPSEQAMGFPKPASDIYAVGAIGIECLTGREPHQLFDEETLDFNWQHLYRVSDPRLDPSIGVLVEILNKMLRQRYLDRYVNAQAALQDIDRLMTPDRLSKSVQIVSSRGVVAPLDRAAFLKLLALGGFGAIGSFAVSQIVKQIEHQKAPQVIHFGSMTQPTTIEFNSVKLNDSGDIIDTPRGRAQIFQEELGRDIFLTMVKIPAGRFLMGSPPGEPARTVKEQPQHQVSISEFYLGQTLVTQAQWAAIFPDRQNGSIDNNLVPVHSINWLDAIDFCDRLSQKTGHNYRLPTESEWEYACRANTTTPFAYGDTITPSVVNYNGNCPYGQAPKGEFRQQVTPVAKFPPNLFGLYDMHGNLWEWCLDEWFDDYRNSPSDGSAMGNLNLKDDRLFRVVRGGSWFSHAQICRTANRTGLFAAFRHSFYGMRVVCDPIRS